MWLSTVVCSVMLTLGLFLAPSPSHAQAGAKMRRIGILTPAFDPHPGLVAFRQELRELGYVEGESIALEYRSAEGNDARLPALAAELVRLQVALILADTEHVAWAAQQVTGTIPIVITAGDPVGLGLVASAARPGGNSTGMSIMVPELDGKRLELLKAAVPGVTRVAHLWHASALSDRDLQETERAARALGLQLHSVEVQEPYPFEQAFATMAEAHVDALFTMPSPVLFPRHIQIVALAAQMRLPGMFPDREFAAAGGLMAYGPSVPAIFRRAATYVDQILKGANPGDLPIEYPTKFELVINLKAAQALGITIPPALLILADEVIK